MGQRIHDLFPEAAPDPRFVCPSCGSKGFTPSILPRSCTFCDGTEGGNPPDPPDRSAAPAAPVRTVRTEPVAAMQAQVEADLQAAMGVAEEAVSVDAVLATLPFGFLSGPAGTGKTWLAREIVKSREDAVLLATTGIAAVNLGDATTINSALAYFNTQSMMEQYASGYLQHRLRMLRRSGIRLLVVDEVSMLDADQLTILCQAMDELDQQKTYDKDLGIGWEFTDGDLRMKLLLVGDFAQLPPVEAPFAFESSEWHRFADHTTTLTAIRRQGDPTFIAALQAVRRGKSREALPILEPQMVASLDFNFPGTTIVALNAEVDRINGMRHSKLPGEPVVWPTVRSGEQQKDWLKQIPESVAVKPGALVMILANRPYVKDEADENPLNRLMYANGELATIVGLEAHGIRVMLHRTFEEITVIPALKQWLEPTGKKNPRFTVKGAVQYMPLRLAYATTVHKSQGLSLDQVQISLVNWMFGKPGMAYVALSRCRTLEGLRIVGNPKMFLGKCGVDPKVTSYL